MLLLFLFSYKLALNRKGLVYFDLLGLASIPSEFIKLSVV